VQGEIFAAEGYAKTTGRVGVCIATSGPGATNLVTGLADAMMDSVPLVAITGQVGGTQLAGGRGMLRPGGGWVQDIWIWAWQMP
jgi:thiamine pyrophosphate-dependent acetolactate synthase large subunit-like protein